MDVVLLGTGSPIPSATRAGPASLVRTPGANLLIDAGRGVIMRLTGAGVAPQALGAVMITHMHSDHICDLNDVITCHWIMSPAPAPLRVYGPVGTNALVDATLAMLAFDTRYRIDHHDDLNEPPQVLVTEIGPGDTFEVGDCRIGAYETSHSPVHPTLGFRIESDCSGLDALCANADIYVQTVIRDDLVRRVPSPRLQDILDYHSTVRQAGETAARAGVKTLMLTHYVPPLFPGQEDEWRAIAAECFGGAIILGDDLTSASA
jgi:ribonuclease Z